MSARHHTAEQIHWQVHWKTISLNSLIQTTQCAFLQSQVRISSSRNAERKQADIWKLRNCSADSMAVERGWKTPLWNADQIPRLGMASLLQRRLSLTPVVWSWSFRWFAVSREGTDASETTEAEHDAHLFPSDPPPSSLSLVAVACC